MDTATPIHPRRLTIPPRRRPRRTRRPRSWAACTAMASSASRARSRAMGAAARRGHRAGVPDALERPGGRSAVGPNATMSRSIPKTSAASSTWSRIRGSSPCARRCSGRSTRSSRSGSTCRGPARRTSPGTGTSPPRRDTLVGRRLNSLAFNITSVDVFAGHGAVRDRARHAVGRPDRSSSTGCSRRSPSTRATRQRAQQKMPQMGDISARSALTIHRGTPNRSDKSRPVLVLGVDAPDARNAERHDLQFTQAIGRRRRA